MIGGIKPVISQTVPLTPDDDGRGRIADITPVGHIYVRRCSDNLDPG
jgi:hypothetical protein